MFRKYFVKLQEHKTWGQKLSDGNFLIFCVLAFPHNILQNIDVVTIGKITKLIKLKLGSINATQSSYGFPFNLALFQIFL